MFMSVFEQRMVLNKGPIQRVERRQPEVQQPERIENEILESNPTPATDAEVKKLKGLIQQRDNEISILDVNLGTLSTVVRFELSVQYFLTNSF